MISVIKYYELEGNYFYLLSQKLFFEIQQHHHSYWREEDYFHMRELPERCCMPSYKFLDVSKISPRESVAHLPMLFLQDTDGRKGEESRLRLVLIVCLAHLTPRQL